MALDRVVVVPVCEDVVPLLLGHQPALLGPVHHQQEPGHAPDHGDARGDVEHGLQADEGSASPTVTDSDLPAQGGEDGATHGVRDDGAEGAANVGEADKGRLLLLRDPHTDHVVQGGEGEGLQNALVDTEDENGESFIESSPVKISQQTQSKHSVLPVLASPRREQRHLK